MNDRVEGFAVEPVAVFIHKIPNRFKLAIGGAAGKRCEMLTIGGKAFNFIKTMQQVLELALV